MADIEKVKKGLKCCSAANADRVCFESECPYKNQDTRSENCCIDEMLDNGLEAIEQLEKTVEDQAERIAIMEADAPVHCKDCMYNIWNGSNESPSFWTPCKEIKPEDHWFCWCGTPKPPKEGESNG